ncbi:protein of unknown function DUF218 [Hippea maritima DSM 10411]|uniref:DUF218 domain-containing protein n=2 Tax=Hippea TaxID=84404 RepID=F2LXX2_HIPMA|nr:protein of unknown function DUF218 [Hippea maritima DSM 10411]
MKNSQFFVKISLCFLSKLFTYLILPPGSCVLILITASFLVKRFRWFFMVSAFVLWFISTTPGKNLLLSYLEDIKTSSDTASAVVVLSGGSNPYDRIKTYPEAFKRLMYGILLAKRYNIPLIFSGGGLKYNDSAQAKNDIEIIAKICNCKIKIYFENKSLNTYQNAKYTSKFFEKMKIKKDIFIVTSAYHQKRANILFRYFGFRVHSRPVNFFKERGSYVFWDFLPQMGNFYKSYKAIHEYIGIFSLYLRGIPAFSLLE